MRLLLCIRLCLRRCVYIDVFNSLIDNREEIISFIEQTVERLMDTTAIDKRLFIAKGEMESNYNYIIQGGISNAVY